MTKKFFLSLMIVSLTFATGTMALANGKQDPKPQTTKTEQSAPDGDQASIVKQARHELTMLPYYSLFDYLQFRVEGNTVTLSGQVVSPVLKSDAEQAVSRVKGIEKVVNQIEVLPLSPMDDQIRRAEARAIFGYSTLSRYGQQSVPSIHIIVKNGNVTLKGLVDNQADSNLANIRARGVAFVFGVQNELQVPQRKTEIG